MRHIYLWWIGSTAADARLVADLGRRLAAAFELPVHPWQHEERPTRTYDVRRRQHSSTEILRWMSTRRPGDALKLLGVTDVDLFIPVLTFVYGEAQLDGPAALVSTARLTQGLASLDGRVLASRLLKEAVHELGHTFGLLHCHAARCVMSRSVSVAAIDAKSSALCPECRLRYLERLVSLEDNHA